MSEVCLKVNKLKTSFSTPYGKVTAVNGLDLVLHRGEVLGLVGESGCGKSVSALSILGLINSPGVIESGQILFDGKDLLQLNNDELRKIRGKKISMIFQEPTTALNPVYKVGDQIAEAIMLHQKVGYKIALKRTLELLSLVGITSPEIRMKSYPYQLSGGMCQRVMIAMAFSCKPEILIADEPTTALDVTIQAQILSIIQKMKEIDKTAVMLISHDLGIISENADRLMIMYLGKVMETGKVSDIFNNPLHPYTRGLLGSIPKRGTHRKYNKLISIPGTVPSLINMPNGCAINNRCQYAVPGLCNKKEPDLIKYEGTHYVRCWKYQGWDNE
ncbi:MAG: ABC transporter ATP-binding protein [Balneolaceae bacterium]